MVTPIEKAPKETIPAFLQVISLEKTCIVIQKEKVHNPFFVQKPLILFHWQYFTSITFTKVERLSKPTRHLTFILFQKSGEITCWKEKWEETGPVFSHLSGTVTPCYFQRFKHTHTNANFQWKDMYLQQNSNLQRKRLNLLSVQG